MIYEIYILKTNCSVMKELVVTEETEMEHPNVISIALHDSSFMISFPSAEDKNLWVQALHSANCQVRIVFEVFNVVK